MLRCVCKKGKCKVKELKKVKKVGISCGNSSGARVDRLPVMQCDEPYEEFGDKVIISGFLVGLIVFN